MNAKRMALAGAGIVAAAGLAVGAATLASAAGNSSAGSTGFAANAGYGGYGFGGPNGTNGTNGEGGHGMRGGASNGNTDPSKPMRSDEQLLTGEVAAKVTATAKAKEPDATIQRVETDSDGVYEAHMVRADGTQIIVQIDKDYQVTNVQEMGQGGPGGGGMGHDHGGSDSQSGTPTPSSTT